MREGRSTSTVREAILVEPLSTQVPSPVSLSYEVGFAISSVASLSEREDRSSRSLAAARRDQKLAWTRQPGIEAPPTSADQGRSIEREAPRSPRRSRTFPHRPSFDRDRGDRTRGEGASIRRRTTSPLDRHAPCFATARATGRRRDANPSPPRNPRARGRAQADSGLRETRRSIQPWRSYRRRKPENCHSSGFSRSWTFR